MVLEKMIELQWHPLSSVSAEGSSLEKSESTQHLDPARSKWKADTGSHLAAGFQYLGILAFVRLLGRWFRQPATNAAFQAHSDLT